MNKFKFLFFILFLKMSLCINAQTHFQNYIPNGSFDSIISTDFSTYYSLSQHDSRWIQYPSSAYYVHANSIPNTLPNTFFGYQLPQKGGGMYKMSIIGNVQKGCYESQSYVQVKLYKKLKENKKYRGRFYANLTDSSDMATSRIGMHISDLQKSPIYITPPNNFNPFISAIPQIQRLYGMAVTDKDNWDKIEDVFIATSNMQWMTLGNFYRANQTDTLRVSNVPDVNGCFNEGAAYYFDNLSLVEEDRAVAYKDTTKNYLCVKQGTIKVLGDTANRPWLQYTWRNKNNSIVGTNRNYTYNAAFIENTFFSVEIKDTGEYAFITKAIDTIFLYTSVSPDTVNCEPVGLQEVLKDAETIELYYAENQIKFNAIHERFVGSELVMKSIDGKVMYKTKLQRSVTSSEVEKIYPIKTELQKGFYFVEVVYEGQGIKRKKISTAVE
jgi:hypothetical protein